VPMNARSFPARLFASEPVFAARRRGKTVNQA
jgi:hypothetical protein